MSFSKIVGHNIYNFDLPYLTHFTTYNRGKGCQFLQPVRGKWWPEIFYDTMGWHIAGRQGAKFVGLNKLAKAFGLEGKKDNGKNFHLWDRSKQEEYLENDIVITNGIFEVINETWNVCDNWMVFDIETAPLSLEELQKYIEPFDRDSVNVPKTYKKQEAIDAYIDKAEDSYWPDILDKAALEADTSVPVAIGYRHMDGSIELDFGDPVALCNRFWENCEKVWHNEVTERNKL